MGPIHLTLSALKRVGQNESNRPHSSVPPPIRMELRAWKCTGGVASRIGRQATEIVTSKRLAFGIHLTSLTDSY
jgi:hypothetical protein